MTPSILNNPDIHKWQIKVFISINLNKNVSSLHRNGISSKHTRIKCGAKPSKNSFNGPPVRILLKIPNSRYFTALHKNKQKRAHKPWHIATERPPYLFALLFSTLLYEPNRTVKIRTAKIYIIQNSRQISFVITRFVIILTT